MLSYTATDPMRPQAPGQRFYFSGEGLKKSGPLQEALRDGFKGPSLLNPQVFDHCQRSFRPSEAISTEQGFAPACRTLRSGVQPGTDC